MTELLALVNGPVVPLEALRLALALEDIGLTLYADGETLRLRFRADVTETPLPEATRAEIKRWKWHLLAIASYGGPLRPQLKA